MQGFPGITSDFSAAQLKGFKLAVISNFNLSDDSVVDIDWEELWRFCSIHYTRSVQRVGNNVRIVSSFQRDRFIRLALQLTSRSITARKNLILL